VTRAILENDRVEDFSADQAAPRHEGRHAGTDLQIHECLFHQKMYSVGIPSRSRICHAPTHTSPFEATARSLPSATDAARGSGEAYALTDDEPRVCAERATEAQNYSQTPPPQRDREGCLASASSPSFEKGLLRVANSAFPDLLLRLEPVRKGPAF
jgi:hypothetical protein